MAIKISKGQILFVQAMLIVRSWISRRSKEFRRAKKYLIEWYKKQWMDVSV